MVEKHRGNPMFEIKTKFRFKWWKKTRTFSISEPHIQCEGLSKLNSNQIEMENIVTPNEKTYFHRTLSNLHPSRS